MINELEPDDEQQCQECGKVYVDQDGLSDGFCSDDCWSRADAREFPDGDNDEQDLEED